MIIMSNTVKDVWRFLDDSPCIRQVIKCNLINTRALAKYIIKEKKLEASLDAVIGALRRYETEPYENFFGKAHIVVRRIINLSTRSKLSVISLVKDADVQNKLPKLFTIIQYIKGDILRITQANESIKVLVDTKNLEKVIALFPKDKIIHIEQNLAEINMSLDPKMQETPGVLSVITTELAINGINIVEAITCPPEMLWFVKEKDLLKAYNVLYELCQPQ
jgi:aspartokinase